MDFDLNSPLHYAAKEGRLLAVSYLLSIASDPNLKDRYGSSVLDLALRGGTLHHKYCSAARLDFMYHILRTQTIFSADIAQD